MTVVVCSNCNKTLLGGERDFCEKTDTSECAECRFHATNGTRTTAEYNKWLAPKECK